jgi:hypothetical protein
MLFLCAHAHALHHAAQYTESLRGQQAQAQLPHQRELGSPVPLCATACRGCELPGQYFPAPQPATCCPTAGVPQPAGEPGAAMAVLVISSSLVGCRGVGRGRGCAADRQPCQQYNCWPCAGLYSLAAAEAQGGGRAWLAATVYGADVQAMQLVLCACAGAGRTMCFFGM